MIYYPPKAVLEGGCRYILENVQNENVAGVFQKMLKMLKMLRLKILGIKMLRMKMQRTKMMS